MAVKVAEVKKTVNLFTGFDLSNATSMTIDTTSPAGVTATIATGRITAPASPVTDPVLGTAASETYMQFTTLAADFLEVGNYTLCGTYNDTVAGQVFFADIATLAVEVGC